MTQELIKKKLEKEKDHLVEELDYYKKEDPYLVPDRSTSNSIDDDITETEGHDRITATRISLKERLGEINRALVRIEEGTYGICKSCGKKIGEERLQVMPTASLCIECNRKQK